VSPQPSKAPSNQPSNVPTPTKPNALDMDELNKAIHALQTQISADQDNAQNTQPLLNEPNVINIPDIQPYDAHTQVINEANEQVIDESNLRAQMRALLVQQNVPEDQIETMIQQQLLNMNNGNDEGMM
jgi:hypothetical protein